VAGRCGNGNENSSPIKVGEFLEQLIDCDLFKGSDPWS
jgi:hypothetical protein